MRNRNVVSLCVAILISAGAACHAAQGGPRVEWWRNPPGERPTATGIVANVSPTNIAIETKHGLKAFVVDEKTRVMARGQKATINDVNIGDQAVVKFRLQNDNVPLAVGIVVPRPNVTGKITAIDGNTITLKNPKRTSKVVVTSETQYGSHGYKGTLADLMIGFHAAASGDLNNGVLTAVTVQFVPAVAKGAVTAIQGDVVTIKTVRQLTLNLRGGPGTVALIRPRVGPNVKGASADIKVGMPANVGFIPNKSGASRLLWIDLLTGV